MKNLVKVESRIEKRAAGATIAEVKSKLIEFAWNLQKENYSEHTRISYTEGLKNLVNNGGNLFDSENIKELLSKQKWSEAYKHVVIAAYTLFLEMQGLTWKPPICHVTRKLPFIPTEREIDDLVAGCGKKTACFLQLLKETAMRSGEASKLKWTDIDLQRKTITLNNPEKNGNPRIFTINNKLTNMLAVLPKTNEYVFGTPLRASRASIFYRKRKKLAHKLGNPRLLRIGLHTFRHWKATIMYHETKNPVLVKEFLGHKTLDTTLLYIQLEKAIFRNDADQFIVKAVSKPEEIQGLLEVGFEYVCQKGDLAFLRKRK